MTLVSSGAISLGGSSATSSVNCELGNSGTASINMNDTNVRRLAARTTAGSAICMCNFYGKTDTPPAGGAAWRGGYYMGALTMDGGIGCYYLIAAPFASGHACCCQWKTTNTCTTNAACQSDGWRNSTCNNNTTHPAIRFTKTRSINGFSDWYLASLCENHQCMYLYRNSFADGADMGSGIYWSSTEAAAASAYVTYYINGQIQNCDKTYNFSSFCLRAIRRIKT